MQIFKENFYREGIVILKEIPFAFEMSQGTPGVAHLRNTTQCHISCLSCINPRCLYFNENEVDCDYLEGFPGDKSLNICPVDAIRWNGDTNVPEIDNSVCINCGICVNRCPVGAIYFSNKCEVKVNHKMSALQTRETYNPANIAIHAYQIEQLLKVRRYGVSLNPSDALFENIYTKLFNLKNSYHNITGRNLLIALNCKCSMRRIGDVYTRMDAVYSSKLGSIGAVEIEFGKDTLDASRGILDDIAVLTVLSTI